MVLMPTEKIHLRVDSISSAIPIGKDTVHIIRKGSEIVIVNPWPDTRAPFKPGARIMIEVQLVSSNQTCNPSSEENQWWFFNPDEKDSNGPPRNPFKYLKTL